MQTIRTALGGRAAEIVYYGKENGLSTGASGDLRQASRIAEAMICEYGMDEEIGLYVGRGNEKMDDQNKEKINLILRTEMERAVGLIAEHKEKIDKLVDLLLKKNKLTAEEIEHCLS